MGEALTGRVVNALGQPVDGKGPIDTKEFRAIERYAPGVVDRRSVKEPLQTGLKAIDAMIPDRPRPARADHRRPRTGKTAIGIDTIINQKGHGRHLLLRRHRSESSRPSPTSSKSFEDAGAMDYTTVIVAGATQPAPLQYVAPYAGCAMAEYFATPATRPHHLRRPLASKPSPTASCRC